MRKINIKSWFCKHKKFTAIGIYENMEKLIFKSPSLNTFVVYQCDKCKKEFETNVLILHDEIRDNKININIDKIYNNELYWRF